jgi:hypothetical protein
MAVGAAIEVQYSCEQQYLTSSEIRQEAELRRGRTVEPVASIGIQATIGLIHLIRLDRGSAMSRQRALWEAKFGNKFAGMAHADARRTIARLLNAGAEEECFVRAAKALVDAGKLDDASIVSSFSNHWQQLVRRHGPVRVIWPTGLSLRVGGVQIQVSPRAVFETSEGHVGAVVVTASRSQPLTKRDGKLAAGVSRLAIAAAGFGAERASPSLCSAIDGYTGRSFTAAEFDTAAQKRLHATCLEIEGVFPLLMRERAA